MDHHRTLDEFAASTWAEDVQLDGLDSVILAIANGSYEVRKKVQLAALEGILGSTGEVNVHDEAVQRLDIMSSAIFVDALVQSGRVAAIGCEEIEKPVIVSDEPQYDYIVLMDPLDGSSNIDVAVSIGSIFGIWRAPNNGQMDDAALLRPGNEQIAAAYVIYGSSTVLVVCTYEGVHGFTMHPDTGLFLLTHPDIRISEECSYYSINEGNLSHLSKPYQNAVGWLRESYSQRYVGSLVADFHRNLLKGGVFLYPGDTKNPDGKLRLMYEANPLGFVVERAGGVASTGKQRVLDIIPDNLHQRTSLVLGNKTEVEKIVSVINDA